LSPLKGGLTDRSLGSFEGHGDSLADADTHGRKAVAFASAVHLSRNGTNESGSGHAERMADGDGPTVWVHLFSVIR
jgi:hypothetical protein